MDDVGDVTFELRRRLTTVTVECDILLTEHEAQLSTDTRQSVQRIDDQIRQLITLISRLETAPIADEPIRTLDAEHSPHEPSPAELVPEVPIRLCLPDEPFTDHLVTELDNANRSVHIHPDPDTATSEYTADTESALVLSVRDILQTAPTTVDAALSLITPPEASEPILGVSGMLTPDATPEMFTDVLDAFHDPDAPTAPVAVVEPETGMCEHTIGSILTAIDRTVHYIGPDESIPPAAECILIPPELVSEETLAELRRPRDGRRTPVVVLAEPPTGDWVPTVGGRTFVQRPPTAADVVGELLLVLEA